MKKWTTIRLIAIFVLSVVGTQAAFAAPMVRIKEISRLEGVRDNQIVGYGVVVGLAGTGDGKGAAFTVLSVLSMLDKLGISLATSLSQYGIDFEGGDIQTKNLAAVIVTATLPPFASNGQRLDVSVSTIGDAESLKGVVLLQAPLMAADGKVYAVAQGPVSLGGGAGLGQAAGAGAEQHLTAGRVPAGGIIERSVSSEMRSSDGTLTWVLHRPDFSTAARMADAINRAYNPPIARALDAERVKVMLPPRYQNNPVPFIARIEDFLMEPDERAKVIINERTGTIVFGEFVRVSSVAISHGGLTVTITGEGAPNAAQGAGPAAATITAAEESESTLLLPVGATIKEVVRALNAIGARPNDIIAIIQAVSQAGALHAELEFI